MKPDELRPNKILRGPLFPEPVQVIVTMPMGAGVKLIGKGLQTSKVFEVVLTPEKLALLETTPDTEPFDGDSKMFRLGIEAMRLALAFEYDPYFSCPSPGLTRSRTSSKRFTTTSSACPASGSCWQTTLAPARPSWPACSSRS